MLNAVRRGASGRAQTDGGVTRLARGSGGLRARDQGVLAITMMTRPATKPSPTRTATPTRRTARSLSERRRGLGLSVGVRPMAEAVARAAGVIEGPVSRQLMSGTAATPVQKGRGPPEPELTGPGGFATRSRLSFED